MLNIFYVPGGGLNALQGLIYSIFPTTPLWSLCYYSFLVIIIFLKPFYR